MGAELVAADRVRLPRAPWGAFDARGRMLIFFGTAGDLGYLQRLTAQQGIRTETVASQDLTRNGIRVEYFRLSD